MYAEYRLNYVGSLWVLKRFGWLGTVKDSSSSSSKQAEELMTDLPVTTTTTGIAIFKSCIYIHRAEPTELIALPPVSLLSFYKCACCRDCKWFCHHIEQSFTSTTHFYPHPSIDKVKGGLQWFHWWQRQQQHKEAIYFVPGRSFSVWPLATTTTKSPNLFPIQTHQQHQHKSNHLIMVVKPLL